MRRQIVLAENALRVAVQRLVHGGEVEAQGDGFPPDPHLPQALQGLHVADPVVFVHRVDDGTVPALIPRVDGQHGAHHQDLVVKMGGYQQKLAVFPGLVPPHGLLGKNVPLPEHLERVQLAAAVAGDRHAAAALRQGDLTAHPFR